MESKTPSFVDGPPFWGALFMVFQFAVRYPRDSKIYVAHFRLLGNGHA